MSFATSHYCSTNMKTILTKQSKPEKPYPDFPLYAHASGRWAKKVRGQILYFGPWADSEASLDKWLRESAPNAGRSQGSGEAVGRGQGCQRMRCLTEACLGPKGRNESNEGQTNAMA